jgi:hypothetical protein
MEAVYSFETLLQGAAVGGSIFLWNSPLGSWSWGQHIPF